MKHFIAFLVVLGALAILSGCKEEKPAHEVQTVAWYKDHTDERTKVLALCKNNLGELMASPNCQNAQQANNQKSNARRGWFKPGSVDLEKKAL